MQHMRVSCISAEECRQRLHRGAAASRRSSCLLLSPLVSRRHRSEVVLPSHSSVVWLREEGRVEGVSDAGEGEVLWVKTQLSDYFTAA